MANSSDVQTKLQLDKATCLTIHTGNIINELKRKATQSATEELLECIGITLSTWASTNNPTNGLNLLDHVDCFNDKYSVKINKDERKDLKLTVKVLLSTFEASALIQAINMALDELDVANFESVIVAFPSVEERLTIDQIQPPWRALETMVMEGKIITIGISDLDTELLIELHNWALVKPSANQVNLASCCIIPPEMQAFAKENDIQLLTHNDPKEILPDAQLMQMLSKLLQLPDSQPWTPFWIARYSALVKCRGVIQNKGFIVRLQKKTYQ